MYKENDARLGGVLIGVLLICVLWGVLYRTSPSLDDPNYPFIVKKVTTSDFHPGYAYYYNVVNDKAVFSQKCIRLKIGLYNLGDTIRFKK